MAVRTRARSLCLCLVCLTCLVVTPQTVQMQTIDWYDFSIVETINFTAEEEHTLPPPMSEEDLKLLSRAVAAEFSDDSAALPSVSVRSGVRAVDGVPSLEWGGLLFVVGW